MDAKELKELFQKHPRMLRDRNNLRGILRDIFPTERAKVKVLLDAFDCRIVDELRNEGPNKFLRGKLHSRITAEFAVDETIAYWAIDTWFSCYDKELFNNDAPNLPEEICVVEEFSTTITGVAYRNSGANTENRQAIIRDLSARGELAAGTELDLRREPENRYDSNAVAVFAPDGRQLGYLSRDIARKAAAQMDAGYRYRAFIQAVTGGGIGYNYGIQMNVRVEKAVPQAVPPKKEPPREPIASQMPSSEKQASQSAADLLKRRERLVYRANQARRILRKFSSPLLKKRAEKYAGALEDAAEEIISLAGVQQTGAIPASVSYLSETERLEERHTLIDTLLKNAYQILARTAGIKRTATNEILEDCRMLLRGHKQHAGSSLQNYYAVQEYAGVSERKCAACGTVYLQGLPVCLDCGKRK